MSWQAMTAVSRHSKQDGQGLRLILHLAEFADADGSIDPAPNQQTLADHFGCTGRTIRNRLNDLAAQNELVQTRIGSGPGKPSAYKILLPMPETAVSSMETKAETKAEKAETNVGFISAFQQEMAEIKAEIFSLKAEIFSLKAEKAETKGGKGGNERRKEYSSNNAYDPFDPSFDPEGEGEKPPTPPTAVLHPDCPKPETDAERNIAHHPALWVWLEANMAWPGYDGAAYLVERMGDSPNSEALITARKLWYLSNNKPGNAIGILDWYDELCKDPTWTPKKRFSTNGKTDKQAVPSAGMTEVAPGLY